MISPFTRKILFTLSVLFILWLVVPIQPTLAIYPGTETRISYPPSDGCNNIWPSGDNGWIVWEEQCGATPNDQTRILAYNLSTARQHILPNATLKAHSPKMKGNRVVWYEESSGIFTDIYYTDLGSGSLTSHRLDLPDSVKTYPGVDGNYIVWQDCQVQDSICDILLYDVSSSKLYDLTPNTDSSDQVYPSIGEGIVAWQDNRNGEQDIYYNDTSDWSIHHIPNVVLPAMVSYNHPVTDGKSIVWFEDSQNNDLLLSDLSDPDTLVNPVVIDNSGNVKFSPSVCSTFVAWKDDAGSGALVFSDLILYDRTSGTSETITNSANIDPNRDLSPIVLLSDSRILWVDQRNGNPDIYMITLGPEVTCPIVQFSADKTEGNRDLEVHFKDDSLNSPKLWYWDFGDGKYSSEQSPTNKYSANGIYKVRLTAATPNCRNTTLYDKAMTISVGIPTVDFSASKTEGIAPLTVSFTGSGTNAPNSWAWVFGDLGTSTEQNPAHIYNDGGTYSVALTASNDIGSGSKTRTNYITALNGTQVTGTVSGSFFQSGDIIAKNFSSTVGNNLPINYQLTINSGDYGKTITTQLWENEAPSDDSDLSTIIHNSGYGNKDVAYTMTLLRDGVTSPSSATLNFSVSSAWETGAGNIATARTKTFLIAHGYNSNGDEVGIILPTTYVGNDTVNHIEYFAVDVPSQYTFLNKFALAKLSGSGNPFQLITLTIASQVNAPSSSSSSNGGTGSSTDSSNPGTGGSKGVAAQAPQKGAEQKAPPEFVDPGKTASLYTNANGVITQETSLKSTDALATVVLKEGTIAHDPTGTPLSSVSIASLPGDAIPAAPPGQAVMIDGRVYELGPDKATFSPGITVTFTIPQAQWGKEYSLMMHDRTTGTWSEIPGSFSAKDGTFTAVLSHFCCVALFEKEIGQPAVPHTTRVPQPETTRLAPVETPAPQPPQSALSIVFSMTEWITGEAAHRSSYLTAFAIISVIVLSIMLLHRRRNNP